MKKLLSVILIGAMLLSFWGCGEKENEFELPPKEEETINFDEINELEPVNGVYQVHSPEGVLNMAKHLDGKFEILRDIDMGGVTWVPIGTKAAPFKGQITGNEFTIKNFKIEAPTADGDLGFFGVNDGVVMTMNLAEVTITPTAATQRVGAMAGTNDGRIQRCVVNGVINADTIATDAFCGGAAGVNTGDVKNSDIGVDIHYNAAGKATIGGIVGSFTDGEVRDTDAAGKLLIADGKDKAVGLLVGAAKDVEVRACAFMGADNRVGGELFLNYLGQSENATTKDCCWRDNSAPELPAEIREIREKAVQAMYDMGTFKWYVDELINTQCVNGCTAQICHTALVPGVEYRGLPYKHSASTLYRARYALEEDGKLKDWVVDLGPLGGFVTYMGNDCYRAVQTAWSTVANSMNSSNCMEFVMYPEEVGAVPIGNWSKVWVNRISDQYTQKCIALVGEQAICEDYAKLRAGDVLIKIGSAGAHAIMVSQDPVIVRDDEGNIDPTRSYIYNHEQGGDNITDQGYVTSWGINAQKHFARLISEAYLPLTIKEMQEGEKDIPTATMKDSPDNILGLTTGIVESNFYVDSVTMKITDEKGKEVFNREMFARIDKVTDYETIGMFERSLTTEFDMAIFTTHVSKVAFDKDKTYHCVITTRLHTGDEIVVKDFTF